MCFFVVPHISFIGTRKKMFGDSDPKTKIPTPLVFWKIELPVVNFSILSLEKLELIVETIGVITLSI
jgi:hypothetical protein